MQITVVAGNGREILTTIETIAPQVTTTLVIDNCQWCAGPFVRTAPHAKFCGASCRKTAFRKAQQARAVGTGLAAVRRLTQSLEQWLGAERDAT